MKPTGELSTQKLWYSWACPGVSNGCSPTTPSPSTSWSSPPASSAVGSDAAVVVVQCRAREAEARNALIKRLEGLIRREFGVECLVEAVAPHTLPRTSSGKLSRAGARRDYIARLQERVHERRRPADVGSTADADHDSDRQAG